MKTSTIRQSLILSFSSQYATFLINFLVIVILSRILAPAEIGIYSIAAATISLGYAFREFGVSSYIIQLPQLTLQDARTAFGFTLTLGFGFGVLFLAVGAPLAKFYNASGINTLMSVLALSFVLTPFHMQALAVLRRRLEFTTLFMVNVGSSIMSGLFTVLVAWSGGSYMSMAWGNVVLGVSTFMLLWMFRAPYLFLRPSFRGWRDIVRYGGPFSIAHLLSNVGNSTPDFFIARTLGLAEVGLYSRAQGLFRGVNDGVIGALAQVILPNLAQAVREGGDFHRTFANYVSMLTVGVWPAYFFLACFSHEIIITLFGLNWVESAATLVWLSVAGALLAFVYPSGQLLLASGKTSAFLVAELAIQICRVVFVLVGSFYSIEAVAIAQVGAAFVAVIAYLDQLQRQRFISVASQIVSIRSSLAITLCSGVASALAWWLTSWADMAVETILALGFGSAVVGWLVGVAIFPHPVRSEIIPALTVIIRGVSVRSKAYGP